MEYLEHVALVLIGLVTGLVGGMLGIGYWIFRRSRYRHDPVTGKRVALCPPRTSAYACDAPTLRRIRRSTRGADGCVENPRRCVVANVGCLNLPSTIKIRGAKLC